MKKILFFAAILFLNSSLIYAQTSRIFYSGKDWPSEMWTWPWGFSTFPYEADDMGYTPGTPAFKWGTELPGDTSQGLFFGFDSGVNLSGVWDTESVYFKLRAPRGVSSEDTLEVWLYDPRWFDWDYGINYKLPSYQDLNDGEWHQFAIPYNEFQINVNDINKTIVAAVSFEASGNMINDELYIDDVWFGNPDVGITMTLFNGMSLQSGVSGERVGFANNEFVIAEGEGYTEGSNAVEWENNIVDGYDNAGIGFSFLTQDFSYTFTETSKINLNIKIKAPAPINDDLMLVWRDHEQNTATYILDNSLWDVPDSLWNEDDTLWVANDSLWNQEWLDLKILLSDFEIESGLNMEDIYYFSVSPANNAIPERILIDDIWVGNPFIDIIPPAPPDILEVLTQDDYFNTIIWNNVEELGASYNVYGSMDPITDLSAEGVFPVTLGVHGGEESTNITTHNIYYPLNDGNVTNYYAIETIDASGNISETFTALNEPFTNKGKARGIISLDVPDFKADGDLDEWAEFFKEFIIIVDKDSTIIDLDTTIVVKDTTIIKKDVMFFEMRPDPAHVWGPVDGPSDYSADVYVAIDEENLYVAIYAVDDFFTYSEENTQNWWEDEAIEFYFGLYDLKTMHPYMMRGEEPDYRVVFRPDSMELLDKSTIAKGIDSYYFEAIDDSTAYIIEAKIPFEKIRYDEDAVFTPREGMTIPFEVFATDADTPNGGADARIQLGDHPALNPWGEGPDVWSFAWISMPVSTDVVDVRTIPYEFSLSNNYPNPFNPSTKINFTLANTANVDLIVYNSLGQKIATLVSSKLQAGKHVATWNGKDNSGRQVASGIYFYQLISGKMMQTKKMVLLK